ncbi:PLDc N-terminal domain-containing protein [Nocardiopsis sp. EMB25]|uniref:PLDc N-terminal domain-containing protein n=1 Tax=Nocardiopsis sp. EMB25 TaxID=2835867 RepID=UPI0022836858|nr:PLDc N-terminal domain-containing protein [Nocardiopsis sp. EMB25]MCY9786711.1 PLDc N-terminal domain-containing protein [Nocardiopsis sp. EMB25]
MFTYLADTTDTAYTWATGIVGVIVLIIGLALLVLLVAAVISTLMHKDTTAGGKLLWIILEVWWPLLGSVAWFVVGRKGHLNRFLGISKERARHSTPSVGQHSNVSVNNQEGLGHA